MDRDHAASFLATRLAMHTVDAARALQLNPRPFPLYEECAAIIARTTREACEKIGIGEAYAEALREVSAFARVTVREV